MNFPIIKTINDVLPHIEGCDSFKVFDKGDYLVINYMLAGNDTFPYGDDLTARIRRECRGLIFDRNGVLIRRPYHKFFNLGERTDTITFDVARPHNILEKLDGSMITPLWIDGFCRLATKAGITDTSMACEMHILSKNNYSEFFVWCEKNDITPIFEWLNPADQIVISHKEPSLVLTAMRYKTYGDYYHYNELRWCANAYDLPLVQLVYHENGSCVRHVDNFADEIRKQADTEGVVVRFADGEMIKVKTDWYVQIHRAKENILFEKNVIGLVLDEKTDDIIPFLQENDREHLISYRDKFSASLLQTIEAIKMLGDSAYRFDRKTFAVDVAPSLRKGVAPIIFKCWGNVDAIGPTTVDFIRNNISSQARVDSIRHLWDNHQWKTVVHEE